MAFEDMFSGMNIFGARPTDTLLGTLTDAEKEKLKNQSLLSGLLGAGATYLAQPKNQNIGLGAILGKSYLGGMQGAQGAYDTALKNKVDALNMLKTQRQIDMEGLTSGQKLLKAYNELDPNSKTYDADKKYLSDLMEKEKQASGMNINLGSPVAGVDAQGRPVFFQSNPKGGAPSIVQGIAPKADEATNKQITGINNTKLAISDYRNALQTWSPENALDPNKRAEMGGIYNAMMLQAKEAFNLGVLNGKDYEILQKVITDPTSAKGVAYAAFGGLDKQAENLDRILEKMKVGMQSKTTSAITSPATKSTPSKKLTDEELKQLYLTPKPR